MGTAARTLLLFGATCLLSPSTFGYAEDVCYAFVPLRGEQEKSPDQVYFYPFSCYDLTCSDGPGSRASLGASCLPQGFAEFIGATMLGTYDANSSLHYETVWLLARLAHLSSEEAGVVAKASQNTDLGDWRPISSVETLRRKGGSTRIATLQKITDDDDDGLMDDNLEGLVRTNYATAGYWAHYVPRQCTEEEQARSGVAPEDGFVGDQALGDYTRRVHSGQSPLPACEAPLQHARDWAFSTRQKPLCMFGMVTEDGTCSNETLHVISPVLGDVLVAEDDVTLGVQPIRAIMANGGLNYDLDAGQQMAGSAEALGVYLHMLGDRISHRACASGSFIEPRPAYEQDEASGATYDLQYAPACGQIAHVLLHEGETGEPSGVVPPRTMQGLEWMLRETFTWAETRQNPRRELESAPSSGEGKDLDAHVTELVPALAAAEAEPCANLRLKRLCEIGKGHDIGWMYSNESCEFPTFPGDERCDEASLPESR